MTFNVGMNLIHLAQNRNQVVGSCKCGKETSGCTKFGEFRD